MAIAITVVLSQLYQELYEFSNTLLLFRLAETALGATVVILVATLVFPLRTRRVLRVAFRAHVEAIGTLVDRANESLMSGGTARSKDAFRSEARAVDACYQALMATAQPLRRGIFGGVDPDMTRVVRLASAARNYSRDLVTDMASATPFEPGLKDQISRASTTLHGSIEVVADAMTGAGGGTYVRSSSLYDRVERSQGGSAGKPDQRSPVIRDLKLIDGSMASTAEFMGLTVADFDTSSSADDRVVQ
jgi:hypothetical protein